MLNRPVPLYPALALLVAAAPPAPAQNRLVPVEVATVGVDLASGQPIALLRDHAWGQLVPIWIGDEEARAIARALQGVEMPRPMTHDLLASVVRTLGGTVEEIAVHGVTGSVYLGRIRVRMGEGRGATVHTIDSRPSDALALAVRTGARIRVLEAIVRNAPPVDFVALDGERQVVRALGITVGDPAAHPELGGRAAGRQGVIVLHASAEAGELGLRRGDTVLSVGGRAADSPAAFLSAVVEADARDPLSLRVLRDGRERTIDVPPGRLGRPDPRGRPI
jgi:bifunctional DNase/RNase